MLRSSPLSSVRPVNPFAACCRMLAIVVLALTTSVLVAAETREWSNRAGRKIQAELISFDPATKKVTLKLVNGKESTLNWDTLSDADQTWLAERQRKLDAAAAAAKEAATAMKAKAGKTLGFQSDGPAQVSYHVYIPTSFDPASPPAMIIMFSPGGSGKSILGSVKDGCEKLGWIGVGCDTFRNNSDEAALDEKWRELLPHIEKTVPHDPDLLYLGGMSGGALRAYDYSESTARPWKGVLAFGGWMGLKPTLQCAPKMAVAMVNGDADQGANSNVVRDQTVLRAAQCCIKTFAFPGGHTVAPPPVVAEAMEWLKASTTPGPRLSAGKRSPTPRDPDLSKVK